MKSLTINGAPRADFGKKATREIRKTAGVPCILYGVGDPIHFTVCADELRPLIFTPEIHFVNILVGGKEIQAIVKDLQFHPVTDLILHVDFFQITPSKPIVMEVPVVMEGLALGVKEGGKLALQMRRLKVKGLYNQIPEKLTINVTDLGLGKTVQVGQLSFPNIELLNAKEAVVCAVKLTRVARGLAAAAAAAGGKK